MNKFICKVTRKICYSKLFSIAIALLIAYMNSLYHPAFLFTFLAIPFFLILSLCFLSFMQFTFWYLRPLTPVNHSRPTVRFFVASSALTQYWNIIVLLVAPLKAYPFPRLLTPNPFIHFFYITPLMVFHIFVYLVTTFILYFLYYLHSFWCFQFSVGYRFV